MTRRYSIIALLFFALIWTSCEKEITLDLPASEEKLVLEGKVQLNQSPELTITKTLDFYNGGELKKISNAIAQITDQNGITHPLIEKQPGVYVATGVKGEAGKVYTMTVNVEGKTYVASTTLYAPVEVANVKIKEAPKVAGRSGYDITLEFDDAESNDFYFIAKAFHVKDGKNKKTERVSKVGNIRFRERFDSGAKVNTMLLTVDKQIFTYFKGVQDIVDNRNFALSSEPVNPETNWNNGALGYFGAFSLDVNTVVVP